MTTVKPCTKCKEVKPLEDFDPNPRMRLGRSSACKECRRTACRAYANRPDSKAAEKARHVRLQAEHRAWLWSLKSGPCTDCRGRFHPDVMQLDHVPERGEKLFEVGVGMYTKSRKVLQSEIDKCDLVCPTCHCYRTGARAGRIPPESHAEYLARVTQ